MERTRHMNFDAPGFFRLSSGALHFSRSAPCASDLYLARLQNVPGASLNLLSLYLEKYIYVIFTIIRFLTSGLISERQTFAPAFSNFSAKALPSPTWQSWRGLVDYKDDIDDCDDHDDDHEDEVDAAATDDDDDNDGKCGDAKGDDGGNEGDDGNEGGDGKGGDDGNQGGDGEGGDECNEGGDGNLGQNQW